MADTTNNQNATAFCTIREGSKAGDARVPARSVGGRRGRPAAEARKRRERKANPLGSAVQHSGPKGLEPLMKSHFEIELPARENTGNNVSLCDSSWKWCLRALSRSERVKNPNSELSRCETTLR